MGEGALVHNSAPAGVATALTDDMAFGYRGRPACSGTRPLPQDPEGSLRDQHLADMRCRVADRAGEGLRQG